VSGEGRDLPEAALISHDRAVAAGEPMYQDPVTGLWVMTTVALLERGHCCDSGCRHCPYS